MNTMKRLLLFICIPLLSFVAVHKFYVSVTNVTFNEKEKSLQITTRIFIDDFQRVLLERYDFKEELTMEKDAEKVNALMEKYLKKKMKIWVNGTQMEFNYLGKKYEDDMAVCYLEIEGIDSVTSLEVESKLLYEIEEDQQNLVHVKVKSSRKSLLLVKENDKGLLKF